LKAKKKILIIAPDYYGIDKSISKGFESLGFDAILKNYRTKLFLTERISNKLSKILPFTKMLTKSIFAFFLLIENKELFGFVKTNRPDMVFIVKGECILAGTINRIRKELKIPCISYQWDDPFYSHQDHDVYDEHRKASFIKSIDCYDHIFVFDPFYVDKIKQYGIINVSYLPLATDEDIYKKVKLSEEEKREYGFDICFVGGPFKKRLDVLSKLKEFNLGVFGDGWEGYLLKHSGRVVGFYKGKAMGEKVLKIYSASKIVMNIHHDQSVHGVNTRTFDIPACGAFEMVDYKPDMENLFSVGKEIVCFKSDDELVEMIRYYLSHPQERKMIAESGSKRVLSSHTWTHRAKQVVKELSEKNILF